VVGDWSRYVSARRYPPRRFLPAALAAVAVSYIIPLGIGALVATAFAQPQASFPENLVRSAPAWYAVVLVPMALFGGLGWSGSNLYSAGLDLGAIAPRLTRARAAVIMSAASLALVLAGSLAWDASNTFSALSLIFLAASAPWAAVIGVGYLRCRGQYLQDDLQVFNRGERGGAYWYTRGWNPAAVAAWAAGCAFGLLCVQTTVFTGPLAGIAGGVDISAAGSFGIAAVLCPALEVLPRLARRPRGRLHPAGRPAGLPGR